MVAFIPERDAEMRELVDRLAAPNLPPLAAGLAIYYSALAISHHYFLAPPESGLMAAIAGGSAAFLAFGFFAARTGGFDRRPHLAVGSMAALAQANCLAHLAVTGEPKQTSNVALVMIGCGLLMYSTRWLAAILAVSIGGWGWLARSWPPEADLPHQAFLVFAATVLAAMTYLMRMRNLANLEQMRRAAREAELEAKLRQLQKTESLSVLAGGVAHDLNNLLVGLLGNAELARKAFPSDAEAVRYLDELAAAGQRASDLARHMLFYTGKSRFVAEPIPLQRLAADLRNAIGGGASSHIPVEISATDDAPTVEGDSIQLQQVVISLADNAVEAIGDGQGRVTIRLDRFEVKPESLKDAVQGANAEPGAYGRIRVSDDGPGLDAVTLERMFDPFYTTKNAGRGLGLAAVSGIVRAHQGAILVDSNEHAGACVTVLLPELPLSPGRCETSGEPVSEMSRRGATVLIADDEAAVRWVARETLRNAGFRVIDVKNGLEALQQLHTPAERIDLALLDCRMPMMTARQVLKAAHAPKVRFVLMSGYEDEAAPEPARNVVGFLQKPFNATELLASVEKALER